MIYNKTIDRYIRQIDEDFVNGRLKNREGSGIRGRLQSVMESGCSGS